MRVAFLAGRGCLVAIGLWLLFHRSATAQHSLPVEPPSPAVVRIEKTLQSRVSANFEKLTIKEFVLWVRSEHEINVRLDYRELEDVGMQSDTLVGPCHLSDVRLSSVLHAVLDPLDLTWRIKSECLEITTPEEAEADPEMRVYLVADLVGESRSRAMARQCRSGDPSDGRVEDAYGRLMDMIMETIAPETWSCMGGAGAVAAHLEAGVLVIAQTREVHDKIACLLESLRKAGKMQRLIPDAAGSEAVATGRRHGGPRARRANRAIERESSAPKRRGVAYRSTVGERIAQPRD